ncbi:hypothetical protein [uncultured Fibrella sp.]|uniref:hypothetical protein n=1 Tax=uncultured Fibrella sp. TaxID=1284596 RepID=UPI0035CC99FF
MKKSNLYYKTLFQRRNVIMDTLLDFFLALSSWPRLILEVPIRRNMGERYFRFSIAVWLIIIMSFMPLFIYSKSPYQYRDDAVFTFVKMFFTWYAYVGYFAYSAWQRRLEIKRLPGAFDFQRFSLSTGQIHERFRNFEFNGQRLTTRQIETLLEPGFFFFTGILLGLLNQPIGGVFHLCSLFYAFSYQAQYRKGDDFILDKIDEQIANEELVKAFVEGEDATDTRGFNFYGRRPADPDARRRVADLFADDEVAVAF